MLTSGSLLSTISRERRFRLLKENAEGVYDLTQPDTRECSRLAAFRELHRQFCREFKFTEWAPSADASAEEVLAQVSPGDIARTLPPLNLLATLQVQPGEDEDNAPKGPEIPQQRRMTSWILQQVFSDTLSRQGLASPEQGFCFSALGLAAHKSCQQDRQHGAG